MNIPGMTAAFPIALLALAACTPLASDPTRSSALAPSLSDDEAAIRTAGDAWNSAYNGRDADALVTLFAPDAVLMPETAHTAKGQAAIREFLLVYVALMADAGYTPVIGTGVDIEVAGNLGTRSGTYSVGDKSGATVDTGKWLETWRKTAGKWSITKEIWNSDMLPLFPPTAFVLGGKTAE
ncbi:MAG: DUF4440 domain-containing protein [Gammaproteobacteria bacterium]